jgi:hypothetical protein
VTSRPQPAPGERPGVSYRVVALGFVVSLAVALAGGGYIYFVLMHFERVAARHVPGEMVRAARLEVEQVAAFDPVRREVLPALDVLVQGDRAGQLPDVVSAIGQRTGIELVRDLREIVVAEGRDGGAWVVALGGRFPRSGVVTGLVAALGGPATGWHHDDAKDVATGPGGLALGQADDGVIVVASSRALLERALPAGDGAERLGLPTTGSGGLVAVRASSPTAAGPWAGVERVVATLHLHRTPTVAVELRRGTPSDPGREDADASCPLPPWPPPADLVGSRLPPAPAAWQSARSLGGPDGARSCSFAWDLSEMDRVARQVGGALRATRHPR